MPPVGLILILILVAFPLTELALLIKVCAMIGIAPVLLIGIGTFLLGATVVRHQGLGVARRFMAATRSGQPPVEPMVEGMLLVLAGGFLMVPGLITDAIGLILLVPPVRQQAASWIAARGFPMVVTVHRANRSAPKDDRASKQKPRQGPTIEGEFERVEDRQKSHPGRPGDPLAHDP